MRLLVYRRVWDLIVFEVFLDLSDLGRGTTLLGVQATRSSGTLGMLLFAIVATVVIPEFGCGARIPRTTLLTLKTGILTSLLTFATPVGGVTWLIALIRLDVVGILP